MSIKDRVTRECYFLLRKRFITVRHKAARSIEKIQFGKELARRSYIKEVAFLREEMLLVHSSKGQYFRETGKAND